MVNATKLHAWSDYINKIRTFLVTSNYLEVFTPYLVEAGAFEHSIESLKVSYSDGHGELHTSPEIEMKATLAQVRESIFQICKSFRDDPNTGIHMKEFTMLEFYKVGVDYRATRKIMGDLLRATSGIPIRVEELSVRDLAKRETGIDIEACHSCERLRDAVRMIGLAVEESDGWEDLFFKLLIEKLEPGIDPETPTILYDYPPQLATMAKIGEQGFAERFEMFWKGMELCNGSTELTAIAELQPRLDWENQKRTLRGLPHHPTPTRLIAAMERGLPDCSGVAVGLDRLFWCLNGKP